jgi:hypothetical protein
MADVRGNVKTQGPRVSEYVEANLWVWGLLALLGLVSFFACGAVWDEVTAGVMEFLFGIMGGGFVLVSVLDYFYESQKSNLTEKRK